MAFLKERQGWGYTYNEIAREFGTVYAQAGRILTTLVRERNDIVFYAAEDDRKPKAADSKPGKTKKKLYWYSPLRVKLDRAQSVAARHKLIQDTIYAYVWENEGCTESAIRAEMLRLFAHLSVGSVRAALAALDDAGKIECVAAVVDTTQGKRCGMKYRLP